MASEIKVDTIVNAGGDNDTGIDLATNDQILLKVANATKLTMNSTGQTTIVGEGGTTTTSVQQGLAKAWCHWTQVSTQTIRDSFNISGITDTGTGKTTLNINNDMSNDDWAGSMYQNGHNGTGTGDWDNHYAGGFISRATGSVAIVGYASALVDAGLVDVIILGDLA